MNTELREHFNGVIPDPNLGGNNRIHPQFDTIHDLPTLFGHLDDAGQEALVRVLFY